MTRVNKRVIKIKEILTVKKKRRRAKPKKIIKKIFLKDLIAQRNWLKDDGKT